MTSRFNEAEDPVAAEYEAAAEGLDDAMFEIKATPGDYAIIGAIARAIVPIIKGHRANDAKENHDDYMRILTYVQDEIACRMLEVENNPTYKAGDYDTVDFMAKHGLETRHKALTEIFNMVQGLIGDPPPKNVEHTYEIILAPIEELAGKWETDPHIKNCGKEQAAQLRAVTSMIRAAFKGEITD